MKKLVSLLLVLVFCLGCTSANYAMTLTDKTDMYYENVYFQAEGELVNEQDYSYMCATVTNNTKETVYDVYVTMALLDAEGNLLCVDDVRLDGVGIPVGGSVGGLRADSCRLHGVFRSRRHHSRQCGHHRLH